MDLQIKRKHKKRFVLPILLCFLFFTLSIPQIIHKNSGTTTSLGTVRDGSMSNAYLLPFSGENFTFFSPFSYFILNNAYVHHDVHKTVLDAYKICETTCPNTIFSYMETSNIDGGRLHLHRTHQNGYSVDYMVPKINKNGNQSRWLDRLGMSHYLIDFDEDGYANISSSTKIDFKTMGKHILAVHEAAKSNGLRIRKIILKLNLQDDLFKTLEGKEIRKAGIYFVQRLSKVVDDLHDDHYHIDFEID